MEKTFLDSKANDMFSKFNNSDLKMFVKWNRKVLLRI